MTGAFHFKTKSFEINQDEECHKCIDFHTIFCGWSLMTLYVFSNGQKKSEKEPIIFGYGKWICSI